jgi:glutamine synthetase
MVCLLHEKPFEGVSGSGKHNNWSLQTEEENLLRAGSNPAENLQFLLFLTAVIKAVDEYQDLLRISVASASNDHRLGACEAPPAILSMFLGGELTDILESMDEGKNFCAKQADELVTGVSVFTHFNKDKNDRNRTSPFAFTGNKFEFRMVGSMQSIAEPNVVLNSAVAKSLSDFYDELKDATDFPAACKALIGRVYHDHKRIVYNGNNYSEEWVKEAEKRGLSNYKTTVDAAVHYLDRKNIDLFSRFNVLTEAEMRSRYEIMMEVYSKQIVIEADTMLEMLRKDILPGVLKYKSQAAECYNAVAATGIESDLSVEEDLLLRLGKQTAAMLAGEKALTAAVAKVKEAHAQEKAELCRDEVLPAMLALREAVDAAETIVGREYWGLPDYGDILYSVKY